MSSSPSKRLHEFLGLSRTTESDGSSSPGRLSAERLEKRRATNRKSQQRARLVKDSLLRELREENELLKSALEAQVKAPEIPADTASNIPPTPSLTNGSSIPSRSATTPQDPRGATIDLDACRQAFMAVLASVCDPHLNTIHAVCQKFSQSRGHLHAAPTLHPPRPVNRPLNIWKAFVDPSRGSNHVSTISRGTTDFGIDFASLNPPAAFIPASPRLAGPLTVPFLEPDHPAPGLELSAADVWTCVLCSVDLSKADAEAVASRITEKVRCYGYGPVVIEQDVIRVCQEFPRLVLDII